MKPIHLPLTGQPLLSVERYWDETRHMIEFLVLTNGPMGREGQYVRRFFTEQEYQSALVCQEQKHIRIRRHCFVIEGHLVPEKPQKKRRK